MKTLSRDYRGQQRKWKGETTEGSNANESMCHVHNDRAESLLHTRRNDYSKWFQLYKIRNNHYMKIWTRHH